jgi:hypothetical protein
MDMLVPELSLDGSDFSYSVLYKELFGIQLFLVFRPQGWGNRTDRGLPGSDIAESVQIRIGWTWRRCTEHGYKRHLPRWWRRRELLCHIDRSPQRYNFVEWTG